MKDKINVCLIGCGRAGMIHARSYNGNVAGAQLIAICDPFEENLKTAQAELNVKYQYTDYNDVLLNDEVDAIVVVTPTQFHKDIVVAAANAGKHVFCEKPMAGSAEECDAMIEACKANNVKLQLGFMRRFDESFQKGKEIIENKQVGEVTMIKSLTHGPSEPKAWMFDISDSAGPIGEVNSHDLDTLRWYAGSEVKMIHAIGRNFRSPEIASDYPDYYDTCAVLLEFENGVLGMVDGAQYVQYGYDARAEILGTHGIAKVGCQKNNNVELVTKEKLLHTDSMPSWTKLYKDAYIAEAKAFVEAIQNDTETEVTGYDGKMALILVQEGLKSLLEKRPVYIGEE
ncbi:Gfo/Idh/MocA family oxidoreductase [Vibrio sp. MACH09]|uniref:Gfo/Idh/MocA family oxidoreductase n=1 Tax=Vibrio sp. MACH09 TaxID=3025122 RepID=UPI00295EF68A|nr:Gfo/Idh/MocA family oxidoreductase [Vibrio sp. MACH09]